jgi:hypothetical protein
MRRDRRKRTLILFALACGLTVVPVLALDGTVVDEAGQPIVGARVCHFVDNLELLCTETDRQGRFQLPARETNTIRAHAEGFNPTFFNSASQVESVVLKRAPVLVVRLIDASTGERIQKGEVLVVYPSGKEQGPFPSNAAGVKIRRGLEAGEVRLVGTAEGYDSAKPHPITLEPGVERQVELKLAPREPTEVGD